MTFLRRFLFLPVVNNARFGSLLRNNNARYQDMAQCSGERATIQCCVLTKFTPIPNFVNTKNTFR